MSLINEALKKAQSQRTNPPGAPPPAGSPPIAASSGAGEPPKPSSFGKVGVLIAVCAVIVSLSVLATVFLLKSPAPQPSIATVTPPDPLVASSRNETTRISPSLPQTSAPAANPLVTPLKQMAVQSSHGTHPATNPTVAKTVRPNEATAPALASDAAAETAGAEVAAAPAPTTPAPEPTPVKVTMRIQALVDKFRVTGIRLSDTDSKVILNEHLFRVDDPVESSIGLRLTKIEEHRLTFVDADGNVYVKRF